MVLAIPLQLAEGETLGITPRLTFGLTLGLAKGGIGGDLLKLALVLKE